MREHSLSQLDPCSRVNLRALTRDLGALLGPGQQTDEGLRGSGREHVSIVSVEHPAWAAEYVLTLSCATLQATWPWRGRRLPRRPRARGCRALQAATLDVLVAELLQERTGTMAPVPAADVLARMARANLAFPPDAVVQVRLPLPGCFSQVRMGSGMHATRCCVEEWTVLTRKGSCLASSRCKTRGQKAVDRVVRCCCSLKRASRGGP